MKTYSLFSSPGKTEETKDVHVSKKSTKELD